MKTRSSVIAACLAAMACCSATGHAQGGFGPPELTLVPVQDGIYMIRSGLSGNVAMLVGEQAVILIDDKFPQGHDGILAIVLSVTDLPVC